MTPVNKYSTLYNSPRAQLASVHTQRLALPSSSFIFCIPTLRISCMLFPVLRTVDQRHPMQQTSDGPFDKFSIKSNFAVTHNTQQEK